MELHVVGNEIVFCKYQVSCAIPDDEIALEEFRQRLGHYRTESYGLLADDDTELADIKKGLDELKIHYTVDDISPSAEQITKANEITGKIGSRTTAMEYILNGVLPEKLAKEKEREDLKSRVMELERAKI